MKVYKFKINGNSYSVRVDSMDEDVAKVTVNDVDYVVELEGTATVQKVIKPIQGQVASSAPAATIVKAASAPQGGAIKSPLPGVILNLLVSVGDNVKVGQRLMILEAMKMENNIDSDKAGIIKSISVGRGDSVLEGDTLVIIE